VRQTKVNNISVFSFQTKNYLSKYKFNNFDSKIKAIKIDITNEKNLKTINDIIRDITKKNMINNAMFIQNKIISLDE